MKKNNTSLTTNSLISKEDTTMKNATIYYAVKNAISNSINLTSSTYLNELKTAIENNSINPTTEYWIEAQKYAKKVIKSTEKTVALNTAYGYINDGKNEDLINDATIRLINRFEYLLKKFYEHTCNSKSEEETIKRFNGAVALIIPSLLMDMWRRVSDEQEYTDTNTLTGETTTKVGKGLHKTLLTTSINQNNANDSDEELTLADSLVSNDISAEEKLFSREAIMDYITPLVDSPREFLGFMCVVLNVSADEIIAMSSNMTMTEIFTNVCSMFSKQYDIPAIMYLSKRYKESDLTYIGAMSHKKQLSNERSSGKTKVKKYILNLNSHNE